MDKPFDRALRRQRRDRATRGFEFADYLYRELEADIVERLDLVTRTFEQALLLGCPDQHLQDALQARGLRVTAADPGGVFARRAGGVQCDEDRLPFGDGRFDLVISIGLLDSVNDLPGALTLIRRGLRPDGLMLAAFAGAGSLPRLRAAMLDADEAEGQPASPRIHPQIDVRAAGDLLARAGFALPVADSSRIPVRYSSLFSLLRDLRAMGATNVLAARSRRPIGRVGLAAAAAGFAAGADPDGKSVETFDIVNLSGWAPAPDQPRPARRGSATASLAVALRPKSGS